MGKIKPTHVANPVHVVAHVIDDVSVLSDKAAVVSLVDGPNTRLEPEMTARYMPKVGDYLVMQEDGYLYVNPKAVFERKYRPVAGHGSEEEIEDEIQAKGLNAPRLTPADIDAVIVGESFTTLPSGKVMVCELMLRNGFTVRGEAATVSKANFNVEIGKKISRENARNKVWELEGYLLQEHLFTGV